MVAETVQQIGYVCPKSAVGTGVLGIRWMFRLWVTDIMASQSHEQVIRNVCVCTRN